MPLSEDYDSGLVFASDGNINEPIEEGAYTYITKEDNLMAEGATQGMWVVAVGIMIGIGILWVISLLKNRS